MVHGKRVHTVGDAELEGGLVGLGLLTARIGGAGQLLPKVAKESRGQGAGGGVHRGDAVTGGHHQVGGTVSVADIFINKVSQLMTNHGKHLVVVHGIHQAGINPHAAIAARKSVDGIRLIHFVVEVQVADVLESRHDTGQPLGILVAGGQHRVFTIGLNHVLGAKLLDLRVADGQSLYGCGTSVHGRVLIHNLQG